MPSDIEEMINTNSTNNLETRSQTKIKISIPLYSRAECYVTIPHRHLLDPDKSAARPRKISRRFHAFFLFPLSRAIARSRDRTIDERRFRKHLAIRMRGPVSPISLLDPISGAIIASQRRRFSSRSPPPSQACYSATITAD